jgi:hypothetical protein
MVEKNEIFNPDGNDKVNARSIIKGSTTGLFNLNATKYKWTKQMYQAMIGNFWVPEKVMGLKEDANEFATKLSDPEIRAYKGILSFLIFLDSIQTVNLPHLSDYVTAPEVNLLLAIQAYQEAIHSQSYATILETVVSSRDREEIYYFWKSDPTLLKRNKFIGQIYQDFIDEPSDNNFFRAMIANYLLEGLYFGLRAGRHISKKERTVSRELIENIPPWIYPDAEIDFDPVLVNQDLLNIRSTMWNYAGIIRTKKRLQRVLNDLNYLSHRIEQFYREAKMTRSIIELRNAVLTASIIAKAAYNNQESVGCHYIRK